MSQYGYLAHHGIKGQKWGVRRYQNADGSLTAQGKARYLTSDGKWTSAAKRETSLLDRARYERDRGMRPGEFRGPLTNRALNNALKNEQYTADINKNGYHNLAGVVTNKGTVSIGLKKDKNVKLNSLGSGPISKRLGLKSDLRQQVNKDGYHNIAGFVSKNQNHPGYKGIGIKVDKNVKRLPNGIGSATKLVNDNFKSFSKNNSYEKMTNDIVKRLKANEDNKISVHDIWDVTDKQISNKLSKHLNAKDTKSKKLIDNVVTGGYSTDMLVYNNNVSNNVIQELRKKGITVY